MKQNTSCYFRTENSLFSTFCWTSLSIVYPSLQIRTILIVLLRSHKIFYWKRLLVTLSCASMKYTIHVRWLTRKYRYICLCKLLTNSNMLHHILNLLQISWCVMKPSWKNTSFIENCSSISVNVQQPWISCLHNYLMCIYRPVVYDLNKPLISPAQF